MLTEALNKFLIRLQNENSAYPDNSDDIIDKEKKEGIIVKLNLTFTDESKKYIHKFGCIRVINHFIDKQLEKISSDASIATYQGHVKMFDGSERRIVLKKHIKLQKVIISIFKK